MNPKNFRGDRECLKWNFRDLTTLDYVIGLTKGRHVAVQAGGNLGVFPARLAQKFKAVYTFEPDAKLFPLMTANAPAENIIRFQAALGAKPGFVNTKRQTETRTHAGVTHISGAGIIPTMRIDDLGFQALDLLYLDIEGFEFFALQGAQETIRKFKPIVVLEVNSCAKRYGIEGGDLAALMRTLGYRYSETRRSDEIFLPGPAA